MSGSYWLDDLCRVAQVVDLPNGRRVRVRSLSDVERRACDMDALRTSAVLAEALKDESSKEYQAILLPVIQGGAEKLREALISYRYLSATREMARTIQPDYIPFPDNPSEDERREVITKRGEHLKAISDKRTEGTKLLVDELRVKLEGLGDEDLLLLFKKHASTGNADAMYSDEYVRQAVYVACETEDGSAKFFKSRDEASGVPAKIRTLLWGALIEADTLDPFLLTSRSATESSTA